MTKLKFWILTVVLTCLPMLSASAEVDVSKVRVDTTPVKSSKDLIQQADLVVLGYPDVPDHEFETGQMAGSFKIVNYVQTMHVKRVLKGTTSELLDLVTTGVNPLPDPSHPLNKTYPGPLAEEDYICFLKKLPNSEYYTIIGGWQGVYPIFDGKTVSLENFGFKEFNGLTVEQMEQKTKR